MSKVLVLLAQGCEELEAVTIIDVLRRGGIDVVAAGLDDSVIEASRGVALMPDTTLDLALGMGNFNMVVLPGGMGGTNALAADGRVIKLVQDMAAAGKHVCAICAAPLVLEKAGLLKGRAFTAYPGVVAGGTDGSVNTGAAVETDGKIITSRGPGTAMDFALRLVEVLAGRDMRDTVEKGLVR